MSTYLIENNANFIGTSNAHSIDNIDDATYNLMGSDDNTDNANSNANTNNPKITIIATQNNTSEQFSTFDLKCFTHTPESDAGQTQPSVVKAQKWSFKTISSPLKGQKAEGRSLP